MDNDELIDYNIKITWHAISRMYNQYAMKHGITSSIGFVLLNINSREGTPATKIAPHMGLEARSLTRILKTMEEKGLIIRRKDAQDGRLVKIFLTALGRDKKEIARSTVKTFNGYVKETIPASKLNVFLETISDIRAIIDQGEIKLDLITIPQ